jgi:DNA polymerase III subunit delta
MTDSPSHPVVLVDGDDPALVAEAARRLVDDLVRDTDRALAVEDFSGEEVDLAVVADGCATPPFLVERRVVVVRDVGRFGSEELGPILKYLEEPLATTVLVLVAGGGQISPKLTAAVKSHGHVVSTKVDARHAGDWVRDRLRRAPVRLDAPAEAGLRDHLGEDVGRLVSLTELLAAAYGEGAHLGLAEIEPYLGEAGSVTPWSFTDSVDSGDTEKALVMMRRLLGGGDRHPLEVFAILRGYVQTRLRIDSPGIRTEQQAAEAMGIGSGRSTYPAKKALAAAQRWGPAGIASAVSLVADAEVDLKGASAWPAEAVLEVLVARLCRLSARPGAGRGPGRAAGRGADRGSGRGADRGISRGEEGGTDEPAEPGAERRTRPRPATGSGAGSTRDSDRGAGG